MPGVVIELSEPDWKARALALLAVAKDFDRGWNAGLVALEHLDREHLDWRKWTS